MGSDPGLEEAALNDDNARENTEMLRGQKQRSQSKRNAFNCIVVAAETEAIFVGTDWGMGRCNCWHLSWVMSEYSTKGGGYRKKEVLQHLTLSHLWKNTTDWALKVFQYLPITALATIKADTAEIFSPAVHICSFLIFFCIVLISFVCLGLFFLQNQQLSNPITRAKLGTSVLMFQEVTLWWYSYTPASFSAIRKNRARSCSHRTSKNSYFVTYSGAWSILPVTNAVIAQLYASGRKWSKVTQLTYI